LQIKKLEASVSAIIGPDKKLLDKSKEIYLQYSTLYSDSEEERKLVEENEFYKFFEHDSREVNEIDHIKEYGTQIPLVIRGGNKVEMDHFASKDEKVYSK